MELLIFFFQFSAESGNDKCLTGVKVILNGDGLICQWHILRF